MSCCRLWKTKILKAIMKDKWTPKKQIRQLIYLPPHIICEEYMPISISHNIPQEIKMYFKNKSKVKISLPMKLFEEHCQDGFQVWEV